MDRKLSVRKFVQRVTLGIFIFVLIGNFLLPTYAQGGGPANPPGTGPTEPPGTGPTEPPGTGPTEPPGTGPTGPPGTGPTEPPGTGPTEPPGTGPTEPPGPGGGPTEPPGPGGHPTEPPDTPITPICHSMMDCNPGLCGMKRYKEEYFVADDCAIADPDAFEKVQEECICVGPVESGTSLLHARSHEKSKANKNYNSLNQKPKPGGEAPPPPSKKGKRIHMGPPPPPKKSSPSSKRRGRRQANDTDTGMSCQPEIVMDPCVSWYLTDIISKKLDVIAHSSDSTTMGTPCCHESESVLSEALLGLQEGKLYRALGLVESLTFDPNSTIPQVPCDRRRLMTCDKESKTCECSGNKALYAHQVHSTGHRTYARRNLKSYYCYATSGPCNQDPAGVMPQIPSVAEKVRAHYGNPTVADHLDSEGCLKNMCADVGKSTGECIPYAEDAVDDEWFVGT